MSFKEIAGKILQGMGPGLLSGIGNALIPDPKHNPTDDDPKAPDPSLSTSAKPNHYKTGGTVQKTGLALVHKGEKITPAKEDVPLSHHRVVMHLDKGGLHRALNVPEGQPIPDEKLQSARSSDNPHVREMANLANAMKSWHHK